MNDKVIDYKKTINLPRTDFPMKADLAQRELEILKFWQEIDLHSLFIEKSKGKPHFILHDGPPYANGNIHLGHTLNKVLKDMIVRYKLMRGFYSPYVPGWDCHGQPIEHNVEKSLSVEKSKISPTELRKKCRDYAMHFVDRQSQQFQRLAIQGDFRHPYLTLDHEYEATNVEVFGKLYERGLVYRGRKPIHWCYQCETALAEAEIEYKDEESPSIYVKFPLKDEFKLLAGYSQPKYFLIWTTTPWTLPANVAVAIHPDADYGSYLVGNEILILVKNLAESVFKEVGLEDYSFLKAFKGKDLENFFLKQPLRDWDSKVILADFVALDQGTGCVHIAPGHGQEDYMIGLEYNLPSPMPVDNRGVFTNEAGKFADMHILEANNAIIEHLKDMKLLLYSSTLLHSYPHCWRCKKPVIFRATEQWFVSMDKDGFRDEVLKEITKVKWIPEWSENRITSMVKERPDWCISRQRVWGVPIPVFYCVACGKPIVTCETINAVTELFRKEGADSWFSKKEEEILPPDFKCPYCKKSNFKKETDILDVWFESGISHIAVLRKRKELSWPADLYVEGSDQHRGWFQSSLLASVGSERKAPYKAVLTHGFLVDEQGRKMSKSLGNVVDPLEVIEESGADILRLWVASSDYSTDIAVSPEILKRVSEAYRRIRNTLRFLMGNLYDFNLDEVIPYEELEEIDKWALLKLHELLVKVTEAYETYKFHTIFHSVHNFCVVDMSGFYLDVLKDRLYTSAADSKERHSAQTVLFDILLNLVKILSPVLAFTSEEVWQYILKIYSTGKGEQNPASVGLSSWPEIKKEKFDSTLEKKWDKLHMVRDEVLKALELARNEKIIGNSLEASVTLFTSSEHYHFLRENRAILPTILIVSQVEVAEAAPDAVSEEAFNSSVIPGLAIWVSRARGEKCKRCWNWSETVGKDKKYMFLCARCVKVIKSLS